ncbi:MAG: hypothetical protein WBW48_17325 [Anaerolineae bacterium]
MQNIRLQYTSWEEMPTEVQALFVQWMDNRAEQGRAFYELYFYWFNIAHELGHALRAYYGTSDTSHWGEETAVNEFAVAYWKGRGEAERLLHLRELVGDAFGRLEDPVPPDEGRSSYFDTHYSELSSKPSAYGHYQFSMVLTALGKQLDIAQVLHTLIMPQAHEAAPPPAAPYSVINADLPARIVNDMRDYLASYGVGLPEIQVVRSFSPMIQFIDWD